MMADKTRVIVTDWPNADPDPDAKIELTVGQDEWEQHWRARRNVSTPIPPQFIDALEASGASFIYDSAPWFDEPADIEGVPV